MVLLLEDYVFVELWEMNQVTTRFPSPLRTKIQLLSSVLSLFFRERKKNPMVIEDFIKKPILTNLYSHENPIPDNIYCKL